MGAPRSTLFLALLNFQIHAMAKFFMNNSIHLVALITLAIIACFSSAHAIAQDTDLPDGVSNSQNPADVSLTPAESLKLITVPGGFKVTLFAGEPDIRRPIAFDFDDRGRLWVVENYSHPKASKELNPDRIVILEDTDNDGQFDKRKIFWSGGRYLSAIAYGHGGVWVGNSPELSFIPDRNRDDVPDSDPIVILDGFVESSNNVLNNFHWGPDGWLYGAIGLNQNSMVGVPGTPKKDRVAIPRGIWRMHPITHKFEVQAIGMVNPWGADFNKFGDLITTNTVISHLWHIVPGMYLQRRGNESDYPFAYGRIQSINDHLHWGGGKWTESRQTKDGKLAHQHSVAGGGHAHCGAMIYQADNWPKKYRDKLFTCNLHGNRVNSDNLVPNKSTYIGTHGDDFLYANDPWFRGLTIKYGPDGGVYVSDWHDFGECHDNDGSHRTSGRIYKIVYGDASKQLPLDLAKKSDAELVGLQTHDNAWHARHARRLLHERFASEKSKQELAALKKPLAKLASGPIEQQLRVLWTRFVVGDLDEKQLTRLLTTSDTSIQDNQHVRRWCVRLLVDQSAPSPPTLKEFVLNEFVRLARTESSPKVRLALVVALQRIPLESRWPIAEALVSRNVDGGDPNIPLMIWYGLEPGILADSSKSLKFASKSKIRLVRQFIARRLLDQREPLISDVIDTALQTNDENNQLDFLKGMRDAFAKKSVSPPENWRPLYEKINLGTNAELKSVAVELARIFGDKQAIADLRNVVIDNDATVDRRQQALQTLLNLKGATSPGTLHDLLSEPNPLRIQALHALALTNNGQTPSRLLQRLGEFSPVERQAVASVLVSRANFVPFLFDSIAQKTMTANDVSAYSLQQLRSYKNESIQDVVSKIWPPNTDAASKADEIARYKKLLTPKYLSSGNASAGRTMFSQNCAKCHMLFGTGGNVGPDLTGSGRANLDYVLSNLVDPSALVDEAYRLTTVLMEDGRLLSGFMEKHGEAAIVLRTQDERVTLPLKEIDEMKTTNLSMMPNGLLRSFTDEQIRDLVVYLASPDQVPELIQD